MKVDARDYAVKSIRDIAGKLRGKSIGEAGEHGEEMKTFFKQYGKIFQKSRLDVQELEAECHEMINEDLDYALTYLFDWDYRINVPKLKKEGRVKKCENIFSHVPFLMQTCRFPLKKRTIPLTP